MTAVLARLAAKAARAPEDPSGWLELARVATRTGRVVTGLTADELPLLLRHWAGDPGQRDLGTLVLPLLGLRDADAEDGGPPSGWGDQTVPPEDQGCLSFDPVTALPIRVRRLVDDAPMCLVGGPFPFYADRFPVTAGRYARFLEQSWLPAPRYWQIDEERDQLRNPDRPVVYAGAQDADTYARWAGARLPTAAEWVRMAGGPARRYPWGESPPEPAHGNWNTVSGGPLRGWWEALSEVDAHPRGIGPWGIQDQLGNTTEWCIDPSGAPGTRRVMGSSFTQGILAVAPVTEGVERDVTRIPNGAHDRGFRLVLGPLAVPGKERPCTG